jgi:hypothetical protein
MLPSLLIMMKLLAKNTQNHGGATNTKVVAISSPHDDATNNHDDAIPSLPHPLAAVKQKCNVKGRPSFASILLLFESCSCETCYKFLHPICYEKLIVEAKKKHNQIPQFCIIKCQEFYIKVSKTCAYTWTNDGQNGKTDPLHSES